MKKVYQDKDNCIDACVASLLGIKLKDVPEIRWLGEKAKESSWMKELNDWLKTKHKKQIVLLSPPTDILYHIANGNEQNMILVISGSYNKNKHHTIIVNKHLQIIHNPDPMARFENIFAQYGFTIKTEYALALVGL